MLVYFGGRSFILKKIPVFFSLIILMAGGFNYDLSSDYSLKKNPKF